MRWSALLVVLLVMLVATQALAHGGGPYRGPPGPPPDGCAEPWDAPPMPPPATYGRGPVTGRVVAADGAPLEDATVWSEGCPVARTNAEGRFRCEPLRYPAKLTVLARGRAAGCVTARAAPQPGAHLDLGDVALGEGRDVAGRVEPEGDDRDLVRVRIVPEVGRVPEAFAAIGEVNGWNGVWVRTGREFVFRGLPAGSYRLVASRFAGGAIVTVAAGVRPGCDPVTIRAADVPTRPVPTGDPLDGKLTLAGIAGRDVAVIDRERSCQLVVKHDQETVTVTVPTDSDLDVVVQDDDGLQLPLEGLRAWQIVALPPTTERTAVEGVVVRTDGSPVAGARVWAAAAADVAGAFRREGRTDASGAFRIDGVCGRLQVHAIAAGLTNDERPCVVGAGDTSVRVVVHEEALPGIEPLRPTEGDR